MIDLKDFFGKKDSWEIKGLIETHKKMLKDKTYLAMLRSKSYVENRIKSLEELYDVLR